MTCKSCGAATTGRKHYCDDCRDTKAPWRPHSVNIQRAADHLGITIPIVVRRSATRKLLGRYHGIKLRDGHPTDVDTVLAMSDEELNNYMFHYITIAARLTVDQASRAIWHELTHAAQYQNIPDYRERYARELRDAKRAAARTGLPLSNVYRMISFEREASANELNHEKLFSLALANSRANMPDLKRPHQRIERVVNGNVVLGPNAALLDRQTRRVAANAASLLNR